MRAMFKSIPIEVVIATSMIAIMLLLSAGFRLPIIYPSGPSAAFVGIHYIYPLAGVALLGMATFITVKREVALKFMLSIPCYAAVLFAHFNIKLWIPFINPTLHDAFYWKIDKWFRPLVEACFSIREYLTIILPANTNFYMTGFMALFYGSFLYHAIKTPAMFRKLVVAVLLLQALGSFAYLLAPAIGPFIYETGDNPVISAGQHGMAEYYWQTVKNGRGWLAQYGSENFTAGLAAMPSLHSAGTFLFFLFAWKYGRPLVPFYSFILFFILIAAVSSRWHYLIDIPVGLGLAWACYWLAHQLLRETADNVPESFSGSVPLPANVS